MRRGVRFESPCASGFTLIEMMVVILIIGVMATFISLSIGNRSLDDRMDVESKRLEALLRLGLEEADMRGIPIGLSFGTGDYRFLAIDTHKHWVDYTGSDAFRPRRLADPFYTELTVEKHTVAPPAHDVPADQVKPQILLLPGGDVTPFTLELRAPGDRRYVHLESDSLGRIRRETRQDPR